MDTRVKNDSMERVIVNRHLIVGWEKDGKKGGDQNEMVYQDKHLDVKRNQIEHIEGNMELLIGKGDASDGGNLDVSIEKQKTETIGGGYDLHVTKDQKVKVDGTLSHTVGDHHEKSGNHFNVEAAQEIHLKAGMKVIIEAPQVSLKGAGGFVDVGPTGVTIQGAMVLINSGGAAGVGSGAQPAAPKDAKEAKPTKPTTADDSKTGHKSCPG
jgi:type VI secretion system secreted protein VgrG